MATLKSPIKKKKKKKHYFYVIKRFSFHFIELIGLLETETVNFVKSFKLFFCLCETVETIGTENKTDLCTTKNAQG